MVVYNYFILLVGILGIFVAIFKIKNDISFRLLTITASIMGILISIARIMSIKHIMNYPIAVFGILTYTIMTYKAWKIRKIPGKKAIAYYWLIGTPCIIVFIILSLTILK